MNLRPLQITEDMLEMHLRNLQLYGKLPVCMKKCKFATSKLLNTHITNKMNSLQKDAYLRMISYIQLYMERDELWI